MPLIEEAEITFNNERALKLRHNIMSFYRKEWVSIFLYQAVRFAGTSKNLKGFSEVHNFITYEKMYFSDNQ